MTPATRTPTTNDRRIRRVHGRVLAPAMPSILLSSPAARVGNELPSGDRIAPAIDKFDDVRLYAAIYALRLRQTSNGGLNGTHPGPDAIAVNFTFDIPNR